MLGSGAEEEEDIVRAMIGVKMVEMVEERSRVQRRVALIRWERRRIGCGK